MALPPTCEKLAAGKNKRMKIKTGKDLIAQSKERFMGLVTDQAFIYFVIKLIFMSVDLVKLVYPRMAFLY